MWRLRQEQQALSERTIADRAAAITWMLMYTEEHPLRITEVGILRYLARPSLSKSTKATYHAHIRAYSRWLVRAGLRKDDPTLLIDAPKRTKSRPRPLSDEQLVRLLAATKRRRTRTMILFAALAGLRVHEIAQLRGEDFDLERGILTVTGKGGKTAMVPLHDLLIEEAGRYPREGWFFPTYEKQNSSCEHITRRGVGYAITATLKRAGIDATPHQLRHWYGTALLDDGEELRVVQELMRHESPATTAIYTKVSMTRERAAIARLKLPSAIKEAA